MSNAVVLNERAMHAKTARQFFLALGLTTGGQLSYHGLTAEEAQALKQSKTTDDEPSELRDYAFSGENLVRWQRSRQHAAINRHKKKPRIKCH